MPTFNANSNASCSNTSGLTLLGLPKLPPVWERRDVS